MIIAADLGSTHLKAAVFAPDGRRLGDAAESLVYKVRTPARAELSPEVVGGLFDRVLVRALEAAGVSGGDVECLALTSQAQTFCVTTENGQTVVPFLSWIDLRAEAEASELREKLGPRFHRLTGVPVLVPDLLLAKALWCTRHRRLPPGHRFVTLPSWIARRFGAPWVLDRNLAAMTGCFSIPGNRWWEEALTAAGLRADQLGPVVPMGEAVPVSPVSPLLPGLRSVVFAGNDHTAGAFACQCSPACSVLTMGTTGIYYRYAGDTPGPFTADGWWGPYPGGGCYELRLIPHLCSALDWADEFLFGSVDSARMMDRARRSAPGAGGVTFDPARWGSPEAWTGRGSREDMARAVLERLSNDICALLRPPQDPGHEIRILGGGSRLNFWVQMIADLSGCRLRRSRTDGLDGAAAIAGLPRTAPECAHDELFYPLPRLFPLHT